MWYKDRKQAEPGETLPYVQHFLQNLAPVIIQRISTHNIASFGKLYEILGTMLSDGSNTLPMEQRLECAQNHLQTLYANITQSTVQQLIQNNITALHYIIKGLLAGCEQEILLVFSDLLDALLKWHIQAGSPEKVGV